MRNALGLSPRRGLLRGVRDQMNLAVTIEEVMAKQAELDSLHIHIVYIGPEKFTIAHTAWERDEGMDSMDDCGLIDWLYSFPGPPVPEGFYAAVENEQEGWELIPVEPPPPKFQTILDL